MAAMTATPPPPARSPAGTALVTGASSGIGLAYARALAGRGHDLVLVARRPGPLHEVAGELSTGGRAVDVLAADLCEPAGLAAVADRAAAEDVTVLVNSAGIHGYGPFAEADPARLSRVIALNVAAPTLLARAAVPHLVAAGRGAIVNVASILAFSGSIPADRPPGRTTYGASKAFLLAHSRLLATELAGTGVAVQAVCPGLVESAFHDDMDQVPAGGAKPEAVVAGALAALDAGEAVWTAGGVASAVLGPYEAAEQAVFAAMARASA